MIEAAGISRLVRGRVLLHPLDLSLRPQSLTVLIGPNGAGKSTLLGLLAGDHPPASGEVRFDGRPLSGWRRRDLARRRAVVTQHPESGFAFTVREIIALGRLPHGDSLDPAALTELAALCDIAGLLERIYPSLSGGERQRVQIARALAQLWSPAARRPEGWLLLDEATAHMDPGHAATALGLLRRLATGGLGLLAVIHDLNLAAAADRVLVLANGCLTADGPPAAVLADSRLDTSFATRFERVGRASGVPGLFAENFK